MKKTFVLLSAFAAASVGFAQAPPSMAPDLKFSGFLQYRTEYTENPRVTAPQAGLAQNTDLGNASVDNKNEAQTMLWLNVDNPFDGHTRFHAIVNAQALSGRTTGDYVKLWAAFVEAKFGPTSFAVGRFLSDVGLGTLGGAPYMDGGHVVVGNELIEAQAYLTRFGDPGQAPDYNTADKDSYTFFSGDVKLKPVKGLTLCGAFFDDMTTTDPASNLIGGALYKSWSVGAEYKYGAEKAPTFTLAGEYADNAGAMARKINGTTVPYTTTDCTEGSDPKAYYVKAKLLGANPFKPGSFGLSVQYRKADAGFDPMAMANPHTWNVPFNWSCPATGGGADNQKGVELAGEVTLLPRLMFNVAYGVMKLVNTTSTLDLGSPALAVVNSVTPTGGAPIVSMVNGAQNKTNQNYVTAQVHYMF